MRQSFRQRLQQFFYGRNGQDQFGLFLFVIAIILSLFNSVVTMVLSWLIFAFAIFRMLSKKLDARRKENLTFMRIWHKLTAPFKNIRTRYNDRKFYKVFWCPKCRQKLRVPKYKGKVKVRCTKCGETFIRKT